MHRRRKTEAEEKALSAAVAQVVDKELGLNRSIWNAAIVVKELKQQHDLDVTAAAICKRLRKDLGLGYKKVSSIPVQANSERCLVLR